MSAGVRFAPCGGSSCDLRLIGFGQCMAGISSLILSDGSQVYVGATGYNYYRGTVFRGKESTNCQSGFFTEPVSFFGYMGYALTAGRILSGDEDTIVASGPRFVLSICNNPYSQIVAVLLIQDLLESYYGYASLATNIILILN